jgi:hypothetical protein
MRSSCDDGTDKSLSSPCQWNPSIFGIKYREISVTIRIAKIRSRLQHFSGKYVATAKISRNSRGATLRRGGAGATFASRANEAGRGICSSCTADTPGEGSGEKTLWDHSFSELGSIFRPNMNKE